MIVYNIVIGLSCTFAVVIYAIGIYKDAKQSLRELNESLMRKAREKSNDLK